MKICNSEFAISSFNFNKILPGLNPDLTVEFIDENNELLTSHFEIDRGTEGVGELVSKAERYASLAPAAQVGFIFQNRIDMELAHKPITSKLPNSINQISYAVISDFQTLHDEAFTSGASPSIQLSYFSS